MALHERAAKDAADRVIYDVLLRRRRALTRDEHWPVEDCYAAMKRAEQAGDAEAADHATIDLAVAAIDRAERRRKARRDHARESLPQGANGGRAEA